MTRFFWFLMLLSELIGNGIIYSQTMEVTEVSEILVTFETATGHQYQIYDSDDWQVGDLASVILFNNETPDDITDDYLLGARYSGFSLK